MQRRVAFVGRVLAALVVLAAQMPMAAQLCSEWQARGEEPAKGNDPLLPAAEWKGEVPQFGFPDEYLAYFPTAKVGDFVLIGGSNRARKQIMEVGEDYLVEARVVTLFGGKTELRWKYKLSEKQQKQLKEQSAAGGGDKRSRTNKAAKASAKAAPKPKPAKTAKGRQIQEQMARDAQRRQKAREQKEAEDNRTEVIKVGDRELECRAVKVASNITDWVHPDVPLDGIVRHQAPDASYKLIDFGRGK